MANQTDPFAESIHGTNPQNLIEKITRLKIYNCNYWKEQCFGLTSESLVDKAVSLKYAGGTYAGNVKPTHFLCLALKMLQLQPEKEIVLEYIHNEDFKYLRLLGAFYLRLVGTPKDIYTHLEALYTDYRKVAYRSMQGWELRHVDDFVESLLNDELCCDVSLPHLPKRHLLEESGSLEPRESKLEKEMLMMAGEDSDDGEQPHAVATTSGNKTSGNKDYSLSSSSDAYLNTIISEADKEEIAEDRRVAAMSEKNSPPRGDSSAVIRSREERERGRARDDSRDRGRDRDRDRKDRGRGREKDRDRDKEKRHVGAGGRRSSRGRSRSRSDSRSSGSSSSSSSHSPVRSSRRHRHGSRQGDSSRRDRDRGSRSRDRDRGGRRDRDRDRPKHRDRDRDRGRSRSRSRSRSSDWDRERRRDRDRPRHRDRSRPRDRDRNRDRSRSRDRKRERDEDRDKKKRARSRSTSVHEQKDTKNVNLGEEEEEGLETVSSSKLAKKPKSSKKFDKMFGKKEQKPSKEEQQGGDVKAAEGSVEYWNQIRESMGMKRLRE